MSDRGSPEKRLQFCLRLERLESEDVSYPLRYPVSQFVHAFDHPCGFHRWRGGPQTLTFETNRQPISFYISKSVSDQGDNKVTHLLWLIPCRDESKGDVGNAIRELVSFGNPRPEIGGVYQFRQESDGSKRGNRIKVFTDIAEVGTILINRCSFAGHWFRWWFPSGPVVSLPSRPSSGWAWLVGMGTRLILSSWLLTLTN